VDGGAVVLAVTAEAGSPLAGVASLVLPTPIGEEKGAGTRSATAALAALLAICGALDAGPAARAGVSANLRRVVESWPAMAVLGSPLAAAGRTWVVGLGSGVGLADAAAITWHEKVRRPAVGLSASEFRHGPIEAARAGDAVIVVDPDEPVPARTTYMDRLRGELTNLGVTVVWLGPASPGRSDPAGVDSAGVTDVSLAARPGPAAALEALVRLQQLARATAHAAGTYRDGFAVLHSIVTAATDI
jgi:fructoselysine-6-P-deglycase FrlB-like protein